MSGCCRSRCRAHALSFPLLQLKRVGFGFTVFSGSPVLNKLEIVWLSLLRALILRAGGSCSRSRSAARPSRPCLRPRSCKRRRGSFSVGGGPFPAPPPVGSAPFL